MLAVFLTILGHISYGTTNVLWKNPCDEIGTLPLIIIRSFCCFIIFSASYFLLTSLAIIARTQFTLLDIVQTVGICAVNYFGLFFFLKSMKHTQVSNTIGLSKIGLVIGIIVGYYVYDEDISTLKIAVCIAVMIGVSFIETSRPNKSSVLSKGLLYTVLSKVFWSTAYFYVPFIQKLGSVLFCSILELTVCVMSCVLLGMKPTTLNLSAVSVRTKREIGLLIFLGTLGTFCLNFALANMSIVLFAIIGLIEPVLGLVISRIYHKEDLTNRQKIGIGIGIAAAFTLTLTK